MDIKQSLKDAREAIDKKDFKKALEICTESLDFHNNFNIHLFMGLSLFNLNRFQESEKSYQNALSLTPASPFPLRGLMDVYTKSGENDKLLKIIEQLLPLTTDESKKYDLQIKLLDMLITAQKHQEAIVMLRELLKSTTQIDARLKLLIKQEELERLSVAATIKQQVEAKMKEKNIPILNPAKRHVIGAPQHTAQQKLEVVQIEQSVTSKVYSESSQLLSLYKELVGNDGGQQLLKSTQSTQITETIYTNYIELLKKSDSSSSQQQDLIYKECVTMNRLLLNSYYPLECLLMNSLDDYTADRSALVNLAQMLVMMHPSRTLGWLGLGYHMIVDLNDRSETSRRMLERGLSKNPNVLLGYQALIKSLVESNTATGADASLASKQHDQVRENTGKALELIKQRDNKNDIPVYIDIYIMLAQSLFTMNEVEKSIQVLEECLKKYPNNAQVLYKLATINFQDRRFEKSLNYFNQIVQSTLDSNSEVNNSFFQNSIVYRIWIQLLQLQNNSTTTSRSLDLDAMKSELEQSLKVQDSYLTYYVLSLILINLGKQTDAIQLLLKSAQKNTNFSHTFSQLGLLYRSSDIERAKKCWQKALSLDIFNEEAGIALSDYYISNQQYTLASSLYKEITRYCRENLKQFQLNVVRCSWAFYRLALNQMDLGELDQSAISFLTAIKGQPTNTSYWRGIGECYRRQTKYIASLKALSHAETLLKENNEKIPELNYQIALLNKILGLYDDAVTEFNLVLAVLDKHVPSLKGKSECQFLLAKQYHTNGLERMALESLDHAEVSVQSAIAIDEKLICLWKLLGDISTFHHQLPPTSTTTATIKEKLVQGANAYGKCQQNSVSTLKDLAINHYYQYIHEQQDTEKRQSIFKSAVKYITQAINLASGDSTLWNIMGIILMDGYPLQSQHAFIRAIQLKSTSFEPYNNLCALYLQAGQIDLANSALLIARSNDPDSNSVWSLQGLIHELNAFTNPNADQLELAHADYVHISAALETQPIGEGLLGSSMLSYQFKDNSTAEQQLIRYISLYPQSSSIVEAHNYLALIYESNGRYNQSIDQLKLAISKLSTTTNTVNLSNLTLNSIGKGVQDGSDNNNQSISIKKCLDINLSRVQLKAGHYKECLDTVSTYITNGDKCATPQIGNSALWEIVALANFNLNQIDKSVQAYQSSVSTITTTSGEEAIVKQKKCRLLLSLAKILYSSNKLPQSEQIVEKVLAVDSTFANAIYLLASIRILNKQYDKASQLLVEFKGKSMSTTLETFILRTIIALETKDINAARKHLISACHSYPHLPNIWKALLDHLNRYHNNNDANTSADFSVPIKSIMARLQKDSIDHQITDTKRHGPDAVKLLSLPLLAESGALEFTFAKSNLFLLDQPFSESIEQSVQQMKRRIHHLPTDATAFKDLSNLLYVQALHSQKIEHFEAALVANRLVSQRYGSDSKHAPNEPQHSVQHCDILMHLSREKEFSELNQSLLKQHEKDTNIQSLLYRQQAKFSLLKKDHTTSLKLYKQSISLNQSNVILYHELSYVYEEMKLYDASLLCLNQSLSLLVSGSSSEEERNQLHLITVGRLMRYYIMMKKWKDAMKVFEDYNSSNKNQQPQQQSILLLFKSITLLISNIDKKPSKQVDQDLNNSLTLLNQVIAINPKLPLANLYAAIANAKLTPPSTLTNSGSTDFNNKIDRLLQQESKNTNNIIQPDKILKDTIKN